MSKPIKLITEEVKIIMPQRVLPFKLEMTQDKITPHAGLAVFGEFVHAMNIPGVINTELPKPGSPRGYAPAKFIEPLLLMLHGGGRSLEDLRKIRMDVGLCQILKIDTMPSSDATGSWLRRMGEGKGLGGMQKVNSTILRRALNRNDRSKYTLDIDASQIVAEKYDAHFTYKGERGYMPMVGHLAENGLVIGDEFREGNEAPASRNLEFIKHCCAQMPKSKKIVSLRADSATYQAEVFNWCKRKGITFAIGGQLDNATKKAINLIDEDEWEEYGGKKIAETIHCMEKTKKSFRLIILRRPIQQTIIETEQVEEAVRYTVIATNREESASEVAKWYNKRGDTSENRIKDLKIGFGMERMPCGTFEANSVFFRIGVMAYNLFVLFKIMALPSSLRKCQIQTVRWLLYQTAGKIVKHAGALYLKVSNEMLGVLGEIRAKNYEVLVM